MNELMSLIAIVTGIAVRLVIPVALTALVVYLLRRLDARWQADGQDVPIKVKKPACWQVKGCSPAQRKDCPGYVSPLPCWQARRTSNGYLREECFGCKVFLKAPTPSLG